MTVYGGHSSEEMEVSAEAQSHSSASTDTRRVQPINVVVMSRTTNLGSQSLPQIEDVGIEEPLRWLPRQVVRKDVNDVFQLVVRLQLEDKHGPTITSYDGEQPRS